MKERYEVIKSIYKDYLILFKEKEEIKYYGIDKKIVETFGIDKLNKVNKIILNNLDIEKIEEYEFNEYDLYYVKCKIIDMLMNM